jgi:hypothetical protein
MDDPKSSGEQDAGPQTQVVKKKYEKPQIIYSAPLEAMAAECNVAPGKADFGICGTLFS